MTFSTNHRNGQSFLKREFPDREESEVHIVRYQLATRALFCNVQFYRGYLNVFGTNVGRVGEEIAARFAIVSK